MTKHTQQFYLLSFLFSLLVSVVLVIFPSSASAAGINCGSSCKSDAACQASNKNAFCNKGICASTYCPNNTTAGKNCSCWEQVKWPCGHQAGIVIGGCDSNSKVGFINVPTTSCANYEEKTGQVPNNYEYCLPKNPGNGYKFAAACTDLGVNRLAKPDGSVTGLTQTDLNLACLQPTATPTPTATSTPKPSSTPTLTPTPSITINPACLLTVSNASVKTAGYTNKNPQASPLNPLNYSRKAMNGNAAVVNNPTKYGWWINANTNPYFTGSGAKIISTAANVMDDINPKNDEWRLFETTFTIPAGNPLPTLTLYFWEDDQATVYLNGTILATSDHTTYGSVPDPRPSLTLVTKTFTPVAGNNTIDFVVRNYKCSSCANPQALVFLIGQPNCDAVTPTPTSTTVPLPPGTVNASCKVSTQTNCDDIRLYGTPISCPITLSKSGGGWSFLNNYDETQVSTSWSVPVLPSPADNTYTISAPAPAGYTQSALCYQKIGGSDPGPGQGTSTTVESNQNVTWDIGFTQTNPWSQIIGGNVAVCNSLTSVIPATANPAKLILDGTDGYPGVLTYKNGYNLDGVNDGKSLVSSQGWIVQDAQMPDNLCTTDWYHYFSQKADLSSLNVTPGGTYEINNFLPSKPTYYINGNLTLNNTAKSAIINQSLTLFVHGTVTIKDNITLGSNGFLAIIADNDITIADSVGSDSTILNPTPPAQAPPDLEGIFVTKGKFFTGKSATSAHGKLIIRGSVIAGNIVLQRNPSSVTVDANKTIPGEQFQYNPELILTLPKSLQSYRISWQEAAP